MTRELSIFVIHIEAVQKEYVRGWFMNPYIQEYIPFYSLGSMILKINHVLTRLMEEEKKTGIEEMSQFHSLRESAFQNQPEYFFFVQVLSMSCQNLQGIVSGTNILQSTFRSALECIQKMRQAIEVSEVKKANRRTSKKFKKR